MSNVLRLLVLAPLGLAALAAGSACSRDADRADRRARAAERKAERAGRDSALGAAAEASGAVRVTRTAVATLPALRTAAGLEVQPGGYGSALAVDPAAPGTFYLLTDRGPNVDARGQDVKLFPVPGFAPHIGVFRMEGDSLRRVRVIELAGADGRPLTGHPNPPGRGGTGETGIDASGRALPYDPTGIDSEGLARMPDGSFWISDEYGPHLLHVNASGKTLERLSPFGGSRGRALPRVLARRRANRGMEGLTATADGRRLVGIMQSPLENPSADAARRSAATRLVVLDPASGATRQYVYLVEGDNVVSAIAALTDSTFLVLERDGEFPGDPGRKRAAVKRVYLTSLAGATDVSDPEDRASGRLWGGRTVEQMSALDLEQAGITAARKTLLLDLTAIPGGFPHDKPEGIAVVDDSTIAVSNDDDFGVVDDGRGSLAPKRLPSTGGVDRGTVYVIRLGRALR